MNDLTSNSCNNKRMNDAELEALIKNDVAWRKELWKKVESLENRERDRIEAEHTKELRLESRLTNLEVRVLVYSGAFSFAAVFILKTFFK